MMRRILLLPLLAVAVVGIAEGQRTSGKEADAAEEEKKEVLKVEEERNQALLKGDTATLDRMYADELAWTNPYGELLTKAQVLANLKSENQKFFTIKHDHRRLEVYGNTVVLTAHTVSTERYKGKTFNYPRWFTNVYVKRDGQWKLVVHQATPIAEK